MNLLCGHTVDTRPTGVWFPGIGTQRLPLEGVIMWTCRGASRIVAHEQTCGAIVMGHEQHPLILTPPADTPVTDALSLRDHSAVPSLSPSSSWAKRPWASPHSVTSMWPDPPQEAWPAAPAPGFHNDHVDSSAPASLLPRRCRQKFGAACFTEYILGPNFHPPDTTFGLVVILGDRMTLLPSAVCQSTLRRPRVTLRLVGRYSPSSLRDRTTLLLSAVYQGSASAAEGNPPGGWLKFSCSDFELFFFCYLLGMPAAPVMREGRGETREESTLCQSQIRL